MKMNWKTWDMEKIKCNNSEIKAVFGSENDKWMC
jgi:hypothetical protein